MCVPAFKECSRCDCRNASRFLNYIQHPVGSKFLTLFHRMHCGYVICKKCKLVAQKLADYCMLDKPNNTPQLGFEHQVKCNTKGKEPIKYLLW